MQAIERTGPPNKLPTLYENLLILGPKIEEDNSQFHGTPAISDGQLFLRSDKFLYCISE